jgi:hypothetical protein
MVVKESILIEERLAEMFVFLPEMENSAGLKFKPKFMYGNELQLLDFLRQHNTGKSVYPLIWMVYPTEETHKRSQVDFDNLTLILAVETNPIMLNDQRLVETYKKVLFPLLDNIKHCLQTSNVSSKPQDFTVSKFPNYSTNQLDNKATYVWDALRVSFSGYFNDNCLNPIFFTNK